ncbi:tRNA 5-methylaminomethyl-2-thiouridine biosynthesis bifunctional MnmC [Gossypium arboreum]|uniref:tRNA 5-methylaminomethyl-2-thiouridine biosynthesis bifunctional MnmC n=1 Tax=Gossypium arboreum TaxID=29729 RepID=A0A0B0MYG6_GOSAR|nr:tRNA 5-methylaminomethyl-2-thiouridine biosynthesis bifunctional MnmC [Gossypium arboreum]
MAQIGRTGHINYPFKAYNFLSFTIFPLSRKAANILAYNRPQYLTATNGTRPTDGSWACTSLTWWGGVAHGAEIRASYGTWGLLRLQTATAC